MSDPAPILDVPPVIPTEPTVPLAALKAERDARQALAAKLAEFEAAAKAAADTEALKRGEHLKLYETEKARADRLEAERKVDADRIAAFEARDTTRRKARAEALPDDLRDLATGLDGDALDGLLDKLEAKARGAAPPPVKPTLSPGRAAVEGGDPDALTPDEEAWGRSRGYHGIASNSAIKAAYAARKIPKQ